MCIRDRLQLGARVEALTREGPTFRLRVRGEAHEFDRVVLATPAPATARLVEGLVPTDVVEFLDRIPHASIDVAHATLRRADLPNMPEGFGYLVPPSEESRGAPPVLGTIFGANLFEDRAPADAWCFSAFYAPGVLPANPEERRAAVAHHFSHAHGWKNAPALRSLLVDEWRDVIPQATIGHAERRDRALRRTAESVPGLVLAGTFSGGVAVEDVLQRGTAAAKELL